MTTLQIEELDLDRMKFNAFRVAEEVSERIDCSVAPDGFMKSFVTKPADEMFYWDKEYLTNYLERKNTVVPGHNYYSKVEDFSKAHIRIGNKCLEFVKMTVLMVQYAYTVVSLAGLTLSAKEYQSQCPIMNLQNSSTCMSEIPRT